MNRYGQQAQAYWQEFLPNQYQEIQDPVAHFTRLGEEMAAQANGLALGLAGNDPSGQGYLAKVSRVRMARLQAEEQVIRETLATSPEDVTEV
jgi:hypothetical protein